MPLGSGRKTIRMAQRLVWISGLVITAVALITYYPALKIGFVNTDWYFLEWPARMELGEYLAHYFDPRLQTGWWRPLFGIFMKVVYTFWKADPFVHHFVHLLLHCANCLLFYLLTIKLSGQWRLALIATIVYAGLPGICACRLLDVRSASPGNAVLSWHHVVLDQLSTNSAESIY